MNILMGVWVAIGAVAAFCLFRFFRSLRTHSNGGGHDGNLISYFRGDYLDTSKCEIEWGNNKVVGGTFSFYVKFYASNGEPYPISDADDINVQIRFDSTRVSFVTEYIASIPECANTMKISFILRRSGSYRISVACKSLPLLDSPYTKHFEPGLLSPEQTVLLRATNSLLSTVTVPQEKNHEMEIIPRDEFDNNCCSRLVKEDFEKRFSLTLVETTTMECNSPFLWNIENSSLSSRLSLTISLFEAGCYSAELSYDGMVVKNGQFDIIVLTPLEFNEVEQNLHKRNLSVWFECRLIGNTDVEDMIEETSPRHRGYSTSDLEGTSPSKRKRIRSFASAATKLKKVYCYVTPKQIIIREYFLKIFFKRISTFRLSPNTKFGRNPGNVFLPTVLRKCQTIVKNTAVPVVEIGNRFRRYSNTTVFGSSALTETCKAQRQRFLKLRCGEVDENSNLPILIIDDGFQNTAGLLCARRNVLVATFVGVIQNNMGRSETFDEKVSNFNRQLLQHHQLQKGYREKVELIIDRNDLLQSSYKATKDLTLSSWLKMFVITFKSENGLDWGGLNREWIHLLCKALFDAEEREVGMGDGRAEPSSGLFTKFKDDAQALVLPNSSSRSGHKLKLYEFAGKLVGKCLLESALGGEHRRQVSARFARSFLAQMTGLPVTCRHFESDDPDLYTTKVKYIIENDVNNDGLTFSEEEYGSGGKLIREVNLIPNGSETNVTNENKFKYLDKVAQYRLRESIKPEIESFIKGLNWLVPDEMLGVFDENEIELLLCGSSHISVEDLKLNCLLSGIELGNKILEWFWNVVGNFTQAELARLLQFTTGCSHLPPDGFKSLQPRFKISYSPYNEGALPTAHTCFNELCLPNYDSYDDLHKMLKIALTEGATGFGLI